MKQLPYTDPLALASHIAAVDFALLHSGVDAGYTGRHSLLCVGTEATIEGNNLGELRNILAQDAQAIWVGWLGYELKNTLETLPETAPSTIQTPPLSWARYGTMYRFDHEAKTATCSGEHVLADVWSQPAITPTKTPHAVTTHSNMTTEEYLAKVERILEHIAAGDIYQANLTRKYNGELSDGAGQFALYQALCEASPAAYSSFIRRGDVCIISSSPEQCVRLDESGTLTSRPIKGTAPIGQSQALLGSEKDRAENLMIVDLMRHDFSRVCMPGTVQVPALFEVSQHAHLVHLYSEITGQLRDDVGAVDVIEAIFPPGSMTGAPKIRAMEIIAALEQLDRGIYSGAIGWIQGNTMELSVTIRTLITQGRAYEFQVGGGIVADSTPEAELAELKLKAKAIAAVLGVDMR